MNPWKFTKLSQTRSPAIRAICVFILCTTFAGLIIAAKPPASSFMNWDSNFGPIALADITGQNQLSEGSSTVNLSLNGDAEISADNSTTAQLSSATDMLVTEYRLTFDGNGSSATGAPDTSYETYDQFLTTPVSINYKNNDDDVLVTLHARASNYSNDVADAGNYTATQTLTVHWIGN